jgi:hypothetical protein
MAEEPPPCRRWSWPLHWSLLLNHLRLPLRLHGVLKDSKQFNHLAQYAPDQVDTDEKKKDRFMIGLSTKL